LPGACFLLELRMHLSRIICKQYPIS
jgi:hypothetical protein